MAARVSNAMQLDLPLVAPRPPRSGEALRAVKLGARVMTYRFRRARRRTISLAVDQAGIVASAPRWVAIAEVEAFIREKERWLIERLAEMAAHRPLGVRWEAGGQLPVLGQSLTLAPLAGVREIASEDGRLLTPDLESGALRTAVVRWLQASALAHFRDRANALAPRIEVPVPRVRLSNARTQWGSCTIGRDRMARIRLHWRLFHVAPPLVDYVIAHELAHIHEMNHSARFWQWVSVLVPHYREARIALRQVTPTLPEL